MWCRPGWRNGEKGVSKWKERANHVALPDSGHAEISAQDLLEELCDKSSGIKRKKRHTSSLQSWMNQHGWPSMAGRRRRWLRHLETGHRASIYCCIILLTAPCAGLGEMYSEVMTAVMGLVKPFLKALSALHHHMHVFQRPDRGISCISDKSQLLMNCSFTTVSGSSVKGWTPGHSEATPTRPQTFLSWQENAEIIVNLEETAGEIGSRCIDKWIIRSQRP